MLKIHRPAKVYAILTDHLRQGLFVELDAQLQQLDRALDELAWKRKQLESVAASEQAAEMLRQIEEERKRGSENRLKIAERRKEIAQLPLGIEMLHSTVECELSIEIGDIWEERVNPEIVLEDGRVVAIRTGKEER